MADGKARKDGSVMVRGVGAPGTRTRTRSLSTIAVLAKPENLEEWDDDELERGYRKDRGGRFRGKPPRIVPIECHRELTRRRFSAAMMVLQSDVVAAAECLGKIIKSSTAEDRDKIRAAQLLFDRVLGKAPERVDVSIKTPKFIEAITAGIVAGDAADENDNEDIIDVESAEVA